MKYSVCVDAVYCGRDFLQSLENCHEVGMDHVEFWSWWDKDLDGIEKTVRDRQMTITAVCTKFISLVDPECREAFLEALEESIAVAKRLNCHQLIAQTGADTGASRKAQTESLIAGLKASRDMLEKQGITLLVEPLNTKVDHPGYFISSSDELAEILKCVNSPNVKMLFDVYHQQITEGDLLRHIRQHLSLIGHIHAAGNPGRHELYRSEIDYGYLFEELEQAGYQGYIGLEYFPLEEPKSGLCLLAEQKQL